MKTVASWEGVTRRYGRVTAVDDVHLSLMAGQAVALVGHNGAGKTTLIKLLLGLIQPNEGRVQVDGAQPTGKRGAKVRRKLGFLPENVAFHGAMTGNELMAFYARLKGRSTADNPALLEQVGLAHAAGRRISTYSKGMRQRLGIAQALIGEPRLLLLDEPTSGLDPASRTEVFALIDRMRRSGVTVLVSTHALAEIEDHVDSVAVVHKGRLLANGTLQDLRQGAQAEVRITASMRDSNVDALRSRLSSVSEDMALTQIEDGAVVITAPLSDKMSIIRQLVCDGDTVHDLNLVDEGLADIYRRLVQLQE